MKIAYDPRPYPIGNIISIASENATLLIPELQRPFVWSPSQVILLMDSIFRGWPFGSILVWHIGKGTYGTDEGVKPRRFSTIVDRTSSQSYMASEAVPENEFFMILDGQQRIQSLLLALGQEKWGFKLSDQDWALDYGRKVRKNNYWSQASLYIDLVAFDEELEKVDRKARRVAVKDFLKWVVPSKADTNYTQDRSKTGYKNPVEYAWDYPGRYIRLSKLWEKVEHNLEESDYSDLLEGMFEIQNMNVDLMERILSPLAVFMKIIETVKFSTSIQALVVSPFTGTGPKDEYNEAIVNIFTRLNQGGETLSNEDITLAWLKEGWVPEKSNNLKAIDCINILHDNIKTIHDSIKTNDIVRLVTFIWSVMEKEGNLLEAKDLLNGRLLKQMAVNLSQNWEDVKESVDYVVELISRHGLKDRFKSFNAVIVLVSIYISYIALRKRIGLNAAEQYNLETSVNRVFARLVDRWILGSTWADVWSKIKNFDQYAKLIYNECVDDSKVFDRKEIVSKFHNFSKKIILDISEGINSSIDDINVTTRSRVSQYAAPLMLWHRLTDDRWINSKTPLKSHLKDEPKIDVDHCVSYKYWEDIVGALDAQQEEDIKQYLLQQGSIEADENTKTCLLEIINSIGNCSLLNKNFNISKGKKTMWDFLSQIDEFTNDPDKRKQWQSSFNLTNPLVEPNKSSVLEIVQAILDREKSIMLDLKKFMQFDLDRCDVELYNDGIPVITNSVL